MTEQIKTMREKLIDLTADWRRNGLPSSSELTAEGKALAAWKAQNHLSGLWPGAPRMVTATLDDGWGMGLQLISLYADLAGVQVHHAGLLLDAGNIISTCQERCPQILGLTVLHFDTEAELVDVIAPNMPETTEIIVGGPIFKAMDKSERAGKPYRVLNDLAAFIEYLLAVGETDSDR